MNGANEGQAGVIFFYLFTGVVGNGILGLKRIIMYNRNGFLDKVNWTNPIQCGSYRNFCYHGVGDYCWKVTPFPCIYEYLFPSYYSHFLMIFSIMNVRKKNTEKFASAVFNLITISYIVITMFIVSYCSLTDVISRTARPFIYFIGFSFGKLVVNHVIRNIN